MGDPKNYLGETLKKIRKAQGLSLDKVAAQTGVSKAMLGQIERAESSPTVATLWKIATGLGVSFSNFIEHPPVPELQKTVLRTADELRRSSDSGGLLIAPLFPFEASLGFEYLELTFMPDYERTSPAHASGVVEIITVMSGEMEILAERVWHPLSVGQSIRFAADQPHGYRNRSGEPVKVLSVIHYPNREA